MATINKEEGACKQLVAEKWVLDTVTSGYSLELSSVAPKHVLLVLRNQSNQKHQFLEAAILEIRAIELDWKVQRI